MVIWQRNLSTVLRVVEISCFDPSNAGRRGRGQSSAVPPHQSSFSSNYPGKKMTRLCVLAAGVQSFPRTNGRSRTGRRASSPSWLCAKTCRLKARHTRFKGALWGWRKENVGEGCWVPWMMLMKGTGVWKKKKEISKNNRFNCVR